MPSVINKHYRIIVTIRKHIVPNNALSSRSVAIRIDKPPHHGIIVSTLQVVHFQFCIVVIATIAQGVDLGHGAGCGEDIAVGIIRIGCNCGTGSIHQIHYIALQVGDVIVGSTVVLQGIGVSVCIIGEIQDIAVIGFPQQLAAGSRSFQLASPWIWQNHSLIPNGSRKSVLIH